MKRFVASPCALVAACVSLLLAVAAGCGSRLSADAGAFDMGRTPVLIYNEDDSSYATGRHGPPDEDGLRAYLRRLAAGGRVTHFFACPNAMRVNWESKVVEPYWNDLESFGENVCDWQFVWRRMHDLRIDVYRVWFDEARACGLSPWLSIRMNDVHLADVPRHALHSRFWHEHPEFRRVPSSRGIPVTDFALDYSRAEVRAYWKDFLAEAFSRYDIDGLELDWVRFCEHLPPGREREFSWCIDEVVREARRLADAAAGRLGHAVRVGCRVLSRPGDSLARGVDFEAWARSGWIDLLVPCNFFGSVDFNLPYAEWRRRVDACSRRGGRRVVVVPGLDNGLVENGRRRRLTLAEYAVFADRMYRQGAPGVYLFNAFDNDGEVYSSLVGEGLPPDLCAERAKGVAVPDGYD